MQVPALTLNVPSKFTPEWAHRLLSLSPDRLDSLHGYRLHVLAKADSKYVALHAE